MKKIGILGGTFNPFHKGHLYIANAAYTQLGLDLVYIMPCGIPPHKDMDSSVTRYQRMSMCQKVCSNYPYLRLLDTELKEDGPSYSYRTLERIREDHHDWELYFIIGEDSLDQFSTWKHPELIAQSASLAVAIRRAGRRAGRDKVCKAIREEYGARIFLLDSDYIDVSSTEIRHIIREKRDGVEQALASLIPAEVLSFIREHRLYSNGGIELSPKKDIKPSDFPRLKAILWILPLSPDFFTTVPNTCHHLSFMPSAKRRTLRSPLLRKKVLSSSMPRLVLILLKKITVSPTRTSFMP